MSPRIACLLLATALAGCAVQHRYTGQVTVRDASLVAIEPDVKVVADAEEPMFFADRSYWLFHDGQWHRSATVRGPWVLERKPPGAVLRIDQPFAYTRFQAAPTSDRVALAPVPADAPAVIEEPPVVEPGMILPPIANPAPSPLGAPASFAR